MVVVRIPKVKAPGDSGVKGALPFWLLSVLGFENFDEDGIASPDGVARDQTRNESHATRGPEPDQQHFRDFGSATGNTTDHALSETRIETAVQEDQIGDRRGSHRRNFGQIRHNRTGDPKGHDSGKRKQAGLEETKHWRGRET